MSHIKSITTEDNRKAVAKANNSFSVVVEKLSGLGISL
jgi:hypothetical protein